MSWDDDYKAFFANPQERNNGGNKKTKSWEDEYNEFFAPKLSYPGVPYGKPRTVEPGYDPAVDDTYTTHTVNGRTIGGAGRSFASTFDPEVSMPQYAPQPFDLEAYKKAFASTVPDPEVSMPQYANTLYQQRPVYDPEVSMPQYAPGNTSLKSTYQAPDPEVSYFDYAPQRSTQGVNLVTPSMNPYKNGGIEYHAWNIANAHNSDELGAALEKAKAAYPVLTALEKNGFAPDANNTKPEMQLWNAYNKRAELLQSPYSELLQSPDLEQGAAAGKRKWEQSQNTMFSYALPNESSMTDEEKKIAYYLYNNDPAGYNNFMQYYDEVSLNRFKVGEKNTATNIAENFPISGTVLSSPMGILGSIATTGELIDSTVMGRPYDPRMEYMDDLSNDIRQGVKNRIGGGVGNVAYDVATGALDIGTSAAMFGTNAVKYVFGNRSAASTISSAKERGASNEEALALGAISGTVEVLTESVGMDRLFSRISGSSGVSARKILGDMLAEGAEEIPGNLVNPISDALIMGNRSEMTLQRDALIKEGYTQAEAEKKVLNDYLAQSAYGSMLAGITAGVLEAPALAANRGSGANGKQIYTYVDPAEVGKSPATLDQYKQAAQPVSAVQNETVANAPTSPVESPVSKPTQMDTQAYTEPAQAQEAPQTASNPFVAAARVNDADTTVSGFSTVGENATIKTDSGKNISLADVEISDPQLSYLYKVASAFQTKEAANTYLGMYDGKSSAPAYTQAYKQYYSAGLRGAGRYFVDRSIYSKQISTDAQDAAYEAGQEYRKTLSAKAWGNFPVEAQKGYSGVIKAYTDASKLSKENKASLQLLDKGLRRLGRKVVAVDTLGSANGLHDPNTNTIYIGLDAIDGGITVAASHELVHQAKMENPEVAKELFDVVLSASGGVESLKARIQSEIDRHAKAGITLTEDDAIEELVCQAMPDYFTTEENVRALAEENPDLFQRVLEWLRELVQSWKDAFKGSPEAEVLRKNTEKYNKALELFESALKSSNAVPDAFDNAGAQYSLKSELRTTPLTEKQFYAQYSRHTITAENVEKAVQSIKENGFKSNYINTLPAQVVFDKQLNVPDAMDRKFPVKKGTVILLVPNKFVDNRNKIMNGWIPQDYEVVTVERDWQPLYELYKKGFEQQTKLSLKSTDSEGNPLTDSQLEFFKDSKVVDENGALVPAYHGSGATFTEFKGEFTGIGNDQYGSGFYFTSDKNVASGYTSRRLNDAPKPGGEDAPNVVTAYLNIKNPIVVSGRNESSLRDISITTNQAYRIIKMAPDIMDKENSILGDYFDTYWDRGPSDSMIRRLASDYDWDLVTIEGDLFKGNATSFRQAANKVLGYDGVIVNFDNSQHYVAWFPNQIKSITNTNPTSSPDIRFSLKSTVPSDADALIRENEKLRGAVAEIKQQFGLTNGTQVSRAAINAMAGKIVRGTGSTYSATVLSDNLNTLFKYLREDAPNYQEAISATADVTKGVLLQAGVDDSALDTEAISLALDVYQQYFDLPEMTTISEKAADKLQEVKENYNNRIADIRREYNERADNRVRDVKDRYAAKDAKQKETAERRKYIDQIKGAAKKLSDRLISNTDKSNVPEAMKKSVLDVLEILDFDTPKLKEAARSKLMALREQYAMLQGQYADIPLSGFYDVDVYEMIDSLVDITEKKPLVDLTTEELGIVRDVVRTVQYMVSNENKLFKTERSQTVSDAAEWTMASLEAMRQRKEWGKMLRHVQGALQQGLLTPTMFFKQFEGTPFHDISVSLRDGIDKHIVNVAQAETFLRDSIDKYNYKKWNDAKATKITTQAKQELEMTVDEMMSVYVLFKRDQIIKTNHLPEGGIILEGGKVRTPTKITLADFGTVSAALTTEQRAYADQLVNFLSTTGAEWGNETSMQLNNIKKYHETYYFPFKVSGDYTKSSPGDVQDIRLANRGFTKKVTKGAVKPIVIKPFTQVWSEHVEQMSMYNALAVPLADMTRVWNYAPPKQTGMSMKNSITRTFTRSANSYITTFLRDLNGGAISPAGTDFYDAISGLAKRAMVTGNLSVYVQQPSAGIRASALIDARYMAAGTLKGTVAVRRAWNEMKEYVPTAQLKEWGYFDTNMTKTIYQRATANKLQKVSDAFAAPVQWGDMLNWSQIWEAAKAETKANNPGMSAEEIKQTASLRVRDVLDQTQVVDSVWHRSEWQRSKGPIKTAINFMSEPIKMYNMLYDATRDFSNGNSRAGVRKVSAVAKSLILNAALRALIVSLRDRKNEKKDKDGNIIGVRTYLDKYVDALGTGLVQAPFGLLPYVADVYSIAKGFDPARLDASLLEKLVGAIKAFDFSKNEKTGELKVSLDTRLTKLADPISWFSGIPISNVYRDVKAIYGTAYETINANVLKGAAYDETLPVGVRLAAAVANESMDKNSGVYYDLLIYCKRYGTQADFDMIKAEMRNQGRTDSTIDSTFLSRMRALEPLVKEGQGYLRDNNANGVKRTVDALVAQGYEYEEAKKMLRSELDYVNGKLKDLQAAGDDAESKNKLYKDMADRGYTKAYLDSLPVPDGEKTEGESRVTMFTYDNLVSSIISGKKTDVDMMMAQFKRDGSTDTAIKSQITRNIKPLYWEAYKAGNTAEMTRIENALNNTVNADRRTAYYTRDDYREWLKDAGISEIVSLIDDGDYKSAVNLRTKYISAMGGLGAITKAIESEYKAKYKNWLQYDPQKARTLQQTLVQFGFSVDRISTWARK